MSLDGPHTKPVISNRDIRSRKINRTVLCIVEAMYPFQAADDRQLSLKPHEKFKIYQKHDSGWWIGENSMNKIGLIPSNYVRVIDENSDSNVELKFNTPMDIKPSEQPRKSKDQILMDELGLNDSDLQDLEFSGDEDDSGVQNGESPIIEKTEKSFQENGKFFLVNFAHVVRFTASEKIANCNSIKR